MRTDRLLLRRLELSDAGAVQRGCGPREVAEMMLRVPHPYPDGAAEAFILGTHEKAAAGAEFTFGIELRAGGELVGCIGLVPVHEHRHAELGYWIAKGHWGRGYATEAVRRVLAFGFDQLGLHRIHAGYYSHNPASGRVLAKTGFRHEGCRRQFVFRIDRFVDLELVGLLRSEWGGVEGRA